MTAILTKRCKDILTIQVINWGENMVIADTLILTESPFFSNANVHSRKNEIGDIQNIIDYLIKNEVYFEIEEILDFVTGEFSRTGDGKFDNVIFQSGKDIVTWWKVESEFIETKINPNGKFFQFGIEDNNNIDEFDYVKKIDKSLSIPTNRLLDELEKSIINGQDLRSEMLIILLLKIDSSKFPEIATTMTKHPNISEILERMTSLFPKYSVHREVDLTSLENKANNEEERGLCWLATLVSEVSVGEINATDESSKNDYDFFRSLFLSTKSIFSGHVFLFMNDRSKKFGQSPIRELIRSKWLGDFDVLEHWTKISPTDIDSWEVRTRSLWDSQQRVECGIVAKQGLEYHPNEHILMRRVAHGLRETGDHKSAIEIELQILGEEGLSSLDTCIYLSRSYWALNDWDNAEKYVEKGLSIDPEREELLKKRALIDSKRED